MSGASQQADVFGSGNIVVQIVGDGNTANFEPGKPSLWLTAYNSPLFAEVEAVAPSRSPRPGYTATGLEEAGLLRPYTRSFALRGRDAPLSELCAWLTDGRPVSVMVVVGAGGRGKTRLALELCAEAAGGGWHAGFVVHDEMERFPRQQALAAWGWNRDVLAVVDYAAAKVGSLRAWLEALTQHPAWRTPGHKKLRLLLLNREGGPDASWWKQAFGEGGARAAAVRRHVPCDRPLALDPLSDPADRRAVFAEAHRRASGADPPRCSTWTGSWRRRVWGASRCSSPCPACSRPSRAWTRRCGSKPTSWR